MEYSEKWQFLLFKVGRLESLFQQWDHGKISVQKYKDLVCQELQLSSILVDSPGTIENVLQDSLQEPQLEQEWN